MTHPTCPVNELSRKWVYQGLDFFCARVEFMKVRLATCMMTLAAASVLFAQPKTTALVKVYVGPDGLAYVVDGQGKDAAIPKEKTQVAVSAPKLAPDISSKARRGSSVRTKIFVAPTPKSCPSTSFWALNFAISNSSTPPTISA